MKKKTRLGVRTRGANFSCDKVRRMLEREGKRGVPERKRVRNGENPGENATKNTKNKDFKIKNKNFNEKKKYMKDQPLERASKERR